jgi:ABC-2 type transport system ATP-binding protein
VIRVQGLRKNFGDVQALLDLSFEASRGEVLGVLGLNGAGKTTLLRILAGELTPTSGTVELGGVLLGQDARSLRSKVGYLPETAPVYRDMTVRAFLRFMGLLNGVDAATLGDRIAHVAELTHVTHHLDRIIGELSMGYRKRVGIAQSILHDPAVVILDEPVSALDPAEIVGMRNVVRSLGGKHTVLVSSHILNEVEETCDRILVLHDGRLIAEGSEAELAARGQVGARLEIVVRGDEPTLRGALIEGASIESVKDSGDGTLRAVVLMEDDRREELVGALVAAGLGLRFLGEHGSELEQVFLKVVQEGTS